jgi:arsenate reductase
MAKYYHYPNCSTCRKAAKWLDANGIEVEKIHLVEDTPNKSEFERLWQASGLKLKKFFNTSGGSYRSMNLKDTYDDLSDDERLELLANDGMLIKRPILDLDDTVLVGFNEATYAEHLA